MFTMSMEMQAFTDDYDAEEFALVLETYPEKAAELSAKVDLMLDSLIEILVEHEAQMDKLGVRYIEFKMPFGTGYYRRNRQINPPLYERITAEEMLTAMKSLELEG